MQRSLASVLFFLGLFAGCADTHQVVRASKIGAPLSKQASAYVAVGRDGSYGKTPYPGSGAMTAQAVAAAFAPYMSKVAIGLSVEEVATAQQSARAGGHTYLLYPQILHWEDRATEWSLRPDIVSVKVSLIHATSGAVIDSVVVGGKSGVATLGGDRPEHLLPTPLAEYAASFSWHTGAVEQIQPAATATMTTTPSPSGFAGVQTPSTQEIRPAVVRQTGTFAVEAERVARAQNCAATPVAVLTAKGAGFESFNVTCSNGDVLAITCEIGACRALK